MVDFKKMNEIGAKAKPIDPIEVFHRLPKGEGINDLWSGQVEALKGWNEKRNEKDVIIKLNTGGGKTLVGLLIAQSMANETNGSTVYLCPTTQLTRQTYELGKGYGFRCNIYQGPTSFDSDFSRGNSILIATYAALFNGKSTFGTTVRGSDYVELKGIILDDAHVAFSVIRDQFTMAVKKKANSDLYQELCNLFRNDFESIGRIDSFKDIISGQERYTVLEVPYWSWKDKSQIVMDRISEADVAFERPLLRDEFDYCHALINYESFSVTPIFPLLDKFPSFWECPKRVYMSATLRDDSSIIRTFNVNMKSVMEPIVPKSPSGVGERMILLPTEMNFEKSEIGPIIREIIKNISEKFGVIILAPSGRDLDRWNGIAKLAKDRESVEDFIGKLKDRTANGPFAFANRYDGVDLSKDSCRLLIMDGKPRGQNIYDSYRLYILNRSSLVNITPAQRIEQGLGRGTRGAGDYCVVLLLGEDLVSWITNDKNLNQLTPTTRIQIEMGYNISKEIRSLEELKETVYKCLERERDWIEYHARKLAESESDIKIDKLSLEIAASERRFFSLMRENQFSRANSCLEKYIWGGEEIDGQKFDKFYQGWLFQLCARSYYYAGAKEKSLEFQQKAYTRNTNLLKPPAEIDYAPIIPGKQCENIIKRLKEYSKIRSGYLSHFNEVVKDLTTTASPNQFEEALKGLGSIIGFDTERPENDIGKGPDVLWLLDENGSRLGLNIEAKSNKELENPLSKGDVGQLLTSFEWFKSNYQSYRGFKIVVHLNNRLSERVECTDLYALTI